MLERHRLIEIAQSLYRYYAMGDRPRRMLDSGCGDVMGFDARVSVRNIEEAIYVSEHQIMIAAL